MQGEELQGDWEGAGGDGLEEECEQKGLSRCGFGKCLSLQRDGWKMGEKTLAKGEARSGEIGTVIQRLSRADLVRQEVLKVGNE